ncbi:uncharacterized protein LOC126907331 [Daktulosphaira vitifoliae]|uniref:uncharacterized protein LOC126907331 n=1 Tax=Daktulosphaira vitifoliae TaxID=58002 RepID=UPI0021A9D478|nr:uncharacterized protein LOC126907331 [Daktulosphaira vitifoliae]
MNSQENNGKQLVESLSIACQNAAKFINKLSLNNESLNNEIITLRTENQKLKKNYFSLTSQLDKIEESIKELAILSDITSFENESVFNILTRLIITTKKNSHNSKKRKLNLCYSPLKLSIKDDSEVLKNTKNNSNTSDNTKTTWKLSIDRNGNPSNLLKKSKQATLQVKPLVSKTKLDIKIQNSLCNNISSYSNDIILSPIKTTAEIKLNEQNMATSNLMEEKNLLAKGDNCNEDDCLVETISDSINCSISHFNRLNKPINNTSITKDIGSPVIIDVFKYSMINTGTHQDESNDSSDETIFSPINVTIDKLDDTNCNGCLNKPPENNLFDSFDIIPGLNNKPEVLPNYKFKENPVRKQNERKQLNGWDCEECRKFYEDVNDNPDEAKNAMNQFSRHRSVKHQHVANTPPGLWDPL